jgi:pimeloyl-ACP methyl ester carboxylesterase
MNLSPLKKLAESPAAVVTGAAAVGAAVTAVWVERRARQAVRDNPPTGRLLDVDGVRLHCVERGEGPPVVLIHGNTVWHRDFEASGLIDRLAVNHRVIAFDRPGFGHSSRPRDRLWTPAAQAALLHAALGQLGVERPVVVGHSMGAMVALALALDHPADVCGLVLLGGYYYPGIRVDALLTAPVALPVLGDVMRYTVTALSARLLLKRLVETMFAPKARPPKFFPVLSREMMLRPVQLRANAEDAAFMIGQAKASSERHRELQLPLTIIAGADDLVIDAEAHSVRLHADLPHSTLIIVPGAGHMVHYAAPEQVVAAVAEAVLNDRGSAGDRSGSTGDAGHVVGADPEVDWAT